MIRFTSSVVDNHQAATTGIGLWLRDRLQPGDHVVDIGANVGDYTSLAADLVGATGHVYAVEPGPENVASLRERFRDRPNVTVMAAAAGDRSGTASLFLDRRDGRRHSVASDNVGKAGGCVQVEQISLDDAFGTLSHLAAIKIDAQGAEHHILRGGHNVLRNLKPALALELWPQGLVNLAPRLAMCSTRWSSQATMSIDSLQKGNSSRGDSSTTSSPKRVTGTPSTWLPCPRAEQGWRVTDHPVNAS